MILGVNHIGLTVADTRATTWLDHVGGGTVGVWATCPNVRLRLGIAQHAPNRSVTPRPVNLPGIAHICLQSRDIEEGLALGVQAGLKPISGPVDLGTEFRYLYAHTNDGILLELEGAPFVADVEPQFWVGHVAFVTRDIETLVGFYGRALGLEPSAVLRLRPNAQIDEVAGMTGVELSAMWLPGLNLGLEFWQYHHPSVLADQNEPMTGFTYVCFECDDFEADCASVVAQGGRAALAHDFDLSGCKTASFNDPEGNRFDLIAFDDPNDPMAIANLPNRDLLEVIAAQRPSAKPA